MLSHPDYNSAQSIKNFLDANGLAMQKKFGQSILKNWLEKLKKL